MIQLWVNLPAKDKKAPPGYQSITSSQIPKIDLPKNAGSVRVIAGDYAGLHGPARTFSPVNVWDIRVNAGHSVELEIPEGFTTSLFVLKGCIRLPSAETINQAELAVMEREGSVLNFDTVEDATLLLLNGKPFNEPIVGHGPFVMNSQEEIRQAMIDYQQGKMGKFL